MGQSPSLGGGSFGYHARAISILKGRLIGVVVAAAYVYSAEVSTYAYLIVLAVIVLATPWLLVKSRLFAMRMTSWRGVRFTFRPDYKGAYLILGGYFLAAIGSAGFLFPRFLRERYKFVVARTGFGTRWFECEPDSWRFFKTMLFAGGLLSAGLLGTAYLIEVIVGAITDSDPQTGSWLGGILLLAAYAVVYSAVFAYTQARNLNEVFNETRLGELRLRSDLGATELALIYAKNFVLIVLTFGLYAPWAQVHLMRYRLDAIIVEGPLEDFIAASGTEATSAVGEEVGEFLDVEFGF